MLLTFCRPDSAHLHKRALGVGPCRDGGDGEGDPAPQTAICGPFFSYLERRRRYTRRRERRAVSNVRTWEPDAVTATCRVVPGTARDSLPKACLDFLELQDCPHASSTTRTGDQENSYPRRTVCARQDWPPDQDISIISASGASHPVGELRSVGRKNKRPTPGWHQHKCEHGMAPADRQCDHALTCLQQLAGRELELRILHTSGHLQRP